MDQSIYIKDLQERFASKRLMILVGAGVSLGATRSALAGWLGLLLDGVERCEELGYRLSKGWGDRTRGEINSGSIDEMLSAAEKISTNLKAQPGEYGRWMRETVGQLVGDDVTVINTLLSSGMPICTTNYDTLFEKSSPVTLNSVSWRQPSAIERIVKGDDIGVIHLHGVWNDPDSVILGMRSYESVLRDPELQAQLKTIFAAKTVLLVGCGAGLQDPNFEALLEWYRKSFHSSEYRHYRLCTSIEREDLDDPKSHIRALVYGESHSQLPTFLESLFLRSASEPLVGLPPTNLQLPTIRRVQVWISQLFRIADFHIYPSSVRAQDFLAVVRDASKLRRAINGRKRFKLGNLGSLKSVWSTSGSAERYWGSGIPDIRRESAQELWLIPFELSLTDFLSARRQDPTSDLGSVLMSTDSVTSNLQLSGRLRIYPTGVGVIRMGITLAFRDSVDVAILAELVRDIEQLMFVDPEGRIEPFEAIFLDVVDQVASSLFSSSKLNRWERRWRPPEITYSLHDTGDFKPEMCLKTLAELISRAPKNNEPVDELERRIFTATTSKHWQREGVLAIVGEGASLLYARDRQRDKMFSQATLYGLTETGEILEAAIYSEKALLEEIERISSPRLLDETWLPDCGESFFHLSGIVTTLKLVLQAIHSMKLDLIKRGDGILVAFATDIWFLNNPIAATDLRQALVYIKDWFRDRESVGDGRLKHLLHLLDEVEALSAPFKARR